MVLTHSWEIVCVLPLGLLCLVFRFLFIPCFTRHRLLLAIFGFCWWSVGSFRGKISMGHLEAMLGLCWAILGLCWAFVGHQFESQKGG